MERDRIFYRGVAAFCLLLFMAGTALPQREGNLIAGGDFEKKPVYAYLSGDVYYINLIRRGWDFEREGPLFWRMPVFTPNEGIAKVRSVEGPGAYEGNGYLLVETGEKSCSAYTGSIAPGLNYSLEFAAKGKGDISFGAYVYNIQNVVVEGPVFIRVKLTEEWRVYKTPVVLTHKDANSGVVVLNVTTQTSVYLDNLFLFKK